MKMEKYIRAPLDTETISSLKAGDFVYISGTIYTARDATHKRMSEALAGKGALPIELKNNIIYYLGPSPAREGRVIGSAGPTTSGRMDKYTPALLDLGLKGMIGKGERSREVIDAIVACKAIYFAAIGGAGALYGNAIIKSELIAFPDLLSEAVYRFEIKDFPCVVAIDCRGKSVYKK